MSATIRPVTLYSVGCQECDEVVLYPSTYLRADEAAIKHNEARHPERFPVASDDAVTERGE